MILSVIKFNLGERSLRLDTELTSQIGCEKILKMIIGVCIWEKDRK